MVLVVIKRFRLVLKVEEWEGRITVHFGFKSHYSLQPLSLPSRYQQRGRGWQTVLQMHQFKLCNLARMNKCRPGLNCVFSSPTHNIGCCWPIFQHFCQRSEAKQQQIVKRNKNTKHILNERNQTRFCLWLILEKHFLPRRKRMGKKVFIKTSCCVYQHHLLFGQNVLRLWSYVHWLIYKNMLALNAVFQRRLW